MSSRKIVIVDDDQDQAMGLSIRLRACGYTVVAARDAIQAIAVIRKEQPDLVVLDIGLPGGDGHTVLQRLRSMGPTSLLPIIVLSAMDPASHRERMLSAGAFAYFQKPADDRALVAAIGQALGESERSAAHGDGPPAAGDALRRPAA